MAATNNTGELTAIVEALRWVLYAPGARSYGEVVLWYDSEYAYGQVSGENKARRNVLLVRNARLMRGRVEQLVRLRFLHVKGHSGVHGNEAADRAAERGAAGEESRAEGWEGWPQEMQFPPRPDPGGAGDGETAGSGRTSPESGSRTNKERRRRGGWRERADAALALMWNAGRLMGEGRAAVEKRAALQGAVERLTPRLVVVVETWADGSHGEADMRLPGYDLIRLDRARRGGNGVAL